MFAFSTPDAITAGKLVAAAIDRQTLVLKELVKVMSDAMQKLVDQVAATTAGEASAVTLIQGIVEQLQASAGDAAKVAELTQQLADATAPLAAAVSANTPPAPPTE